MVRKTIYLAAKKIYFLGRINMSQLESIHEMIVQLRASKRNKQVYILKNIAASIQYATRYEIQDLLCYINSTSDVELLIKLFSILSICVMSSNIHNKTIINYVGVFDKVQYILSRELPFKSTIVLNFVSALVYPEMEDEYNSQEKALSQYAKNVIRVSGCLATMVRFFFNNMMYPDTWRALCQCLSECCRDTDINQNHCSVLIPICIDKCRRGDMHVLPLIHSLLYANTANCERFIYFNGLEIFAREFLEVRGYIDILGALVHCYPQTVSALRPTNIVADVRQILRAHGPHTQIGQWCTVILYHIDLNVKEEENENNLTNNTNNDNTNNNKEVNNKSVHCENTTLLYHNVMKEILNWKNSSNIVDPEDFTDIKVLTEGFNEFKLSKTPYPSAFVSKPTNTDILNRNKGNISNNQHAKFENESNFSCSFLSNNKQKFRKYSVEHFNGPKSPERLYDGIRKLRNENGNRSFSADKCCQTTVTSVAEPFLYSPRKVYTINESNSSIETLKPLFTSTPQHKKPLKSNLPENEMKFKRKKKYFSKRISRNTTTNTDRQSLKTKTIRKQSNVAKSSFMGSRLLSAINESCVVIVNTVKDIIMPNKKYNTSQQPTENKYKNITEGYNLSFTNYMNKRDAIVKKIKANKTVAKESCLSTEVTGSNACNTCNDTLILKKKLENNLHLKETVKKLKKSINVYGCDFKKISKVVWPNETYMTPNVLYNLYRKLILK